MKKSKEKLKQKGIKMHFSLISLIVVDVFLLLTIIVPYIRKRVLISHFVVPTLLAIIVIMFLEFCFTAKTIEGINILCSTIAMLIYILLSSILVLIQTGKEYERENGKDYERENGKEYERAINKIYGERDYDISDVSFSDSD